MASVGGCRRSSLKLTTTRAISPTASPYLPTYPQHTMLRQRHTGGLRVTRCASGPPGASWPGLACWIKDTDGAEVERMVQQGTKGFKEFWARYKKEHDGKVEMPQVPAAPGYFDPAANGNDLLKDVVKYGEMVQSVYDTLETKDIDSQFFGNKWPDVMCPGKELGKYDDIGIITLKSEEGRKYKVVSIIEADSGAYKLVRKKDRNYVGYIAEGPPDANGGVDIAVVFRGTITRDEWVQDAKALQTCWNHGRPVFASPRSQLDGVPFDFSWKWFNAPFLALQLLLSVASLHPDAGSMATQLWTSPLITSAIDSLSHKLAGLFTWLLGMQLQDADMHRTSFCVLAAGLTWLAQGAVAGREKYPSKEEWRKDLWDWVKAILPWSWWFVINVGKTVLDLGDAHISFGFKEMYADAQAPAKSTDPVPPSPRLTVMTTLATLLEKYQSPVNNRKLHIKSITVTGHSLGGALASLCAWDIGNTFNDACTEPTGLKAVKITLRELSAPADKAVKSGAMALRLAREDQRLYDLTDQQRDRLMEAVKQLQSSKAPLPAVAAVTFAAPLVGNLTYASGFKSGFNFGFNFGSKDQPVQPGMLRLVDAPDVVPRLPLRLPIAVLLTLLPPILLLALPFTRPLTLPLTLLALPFPQLFWYVHGGQKLQVDYNAVPYFTAFGKLQGVGARHNHEMYMHLLDPTRDIALVNKTDRVLIKGQKVPGCWWSPVPNSSMIEEGGKWVKAGSPRQALQWHAAKPPHDDDEASPGNGHTSSKGNTLQTKVHEAAARMANVP